MCGIGGTTQGEADAERISRRIKHRGPDMDGKKTVSAITLCHRRLAVIDLSVKGRQPMQWKHLTITFNGEIYNYAELATEHLRGVKLASHSDTEILLHLYEKYGEKSLALLRGQWAFAIHNAKNDTLFLSVDRFGKKPLYYELLTSAKTKKSPGKAASATPVFRFASEGRALLRGTERIDKAALQLYLDYGTIPAPATMWESIRKMLPASWMRVSLTTGASEHGTYWKPPTGTRQQSYEQASAELKTLLDRSVEYRMVADVPVGCFLSGGIDSSIVSAIAHRKKQEHGDELHTFSIGFDDPKYDESKHSQAVADAIGTKHHLERVSVKDLARVFTKLPQIYSEPFADSSALPTYLVSKIARERVTVSLSGDGADELFGGYRTYNHARRLQVLNATPARHALPKRVRGSPHASYNGLLGSRSNHDVLGGALPGGTQPQNKHEHGTRTKNGWVAELSRADIAYYLPSDILVKVDRASMAHALEVRNPFLDHDLAHFALQLPDEFKIAQPVPLVRFINKRILRDTYRTQLPAQVFDRPKQGFAIPEKTLLAQLATDGKLAKSVDWKSIGVDRAATPVRTYRDAVLAQWISSWTSDRLADADVTERTTARVPQTTVRGRR